MLNRGGKREVALLQLQISEISYCFRVSSCFSNVIFPSVILRWKVGCRSGPPSYTEEWVEEVKWLRGQCWAQETLKTPPALFVLSPKKPIYKNTSFTSLHSTHHNSHCNSSQRLSSQSSQSLPNRYNSPFPVPFPVPSPVPSPDTQKDNPPLFFWCHLSPSQVTCSMLTGPPSSLV